jgi:hypothetical protein
MGKIVGFSTKIFTGLPSQIPSPTLLSAVISPVGVRSWLRLSSCLRCGLFCLSLLLLLGALLQSDPATGYKWTTGASFTITLSSPCDALDTAFTSSVRSLIMIPWP